MTNQEALDIFVSCATLDCEHCNMSFRGCEDKPRFNEMRDMVISALEKQIPKKPLQGKEYYWIDSVKYRGRYRDVKKKAYDHRCPSCGEIVSKLTNSFCNYCGQALDWRNEDEGF